MIKIDKSKMGKNDIKPPFVVKQKGNDAWLYLCVLENSDKFKLISLPEGFIQSGSIYKSIDEIFENGYEIYAATISVEERLR